MNSLDTISPVLLLSPALCALIGWLTNYIAVKMLFHPRQPLRLGPLTVQGVFPKRQEALAVNLGRLVQDELISMDDIRGALTSPEAHARFKEAARPYVDTLVDQKLPGLHPMVSMFLSKEMAHKTKGMLLDELDKLIPAIVEQGCNAMDSGLDVAEIVRAKVAAFSMEKLEQILFSIMRKEFRFIELVGGVLGFLIGLVQLGLLLAT